MNASCSTFRTAKAAMLTVTCGLLAFAVQAQNTTLTSTNAGVAFGTAANWDNGVPGTAPGVNDNAIFTNSLKQVLTFGASYQNANAFFQQTNTLMTTTLGIGAANTWTLTNSFVVGQNTGCNATVALSNGVLAVTNGGAAMLVAGLGGRGTFTLNGGTATVDQVVCTNNSAAAINSVLNLSSGVLNSLNGAQVALMPTNSTWTITGTWNVLGGVNTVQCPGTNASMSIGANGKLVVAGPSTVFTNATYTANGVNNNYIMAGNNAQLIVSNGAHIVFLGGSWSFMRSAGNGFRILVTDPYTRFDGTAYAGSGGWRVADGGSGAQFVVSNSAVAALSSLSLGFNAGGCNTGIVTAAGVLTSVTYVAAGYCGNGAAGGTNVLQVSASGQVFCANGYLGFTTSTNACGNNALVTDPGSVWNATSSLVVGYGGSSTQPSYNNVLRIANGGLATSPSVTVGAGSTSFGNLIALSSGGQLISTNASVGGTLKIAYGSVSNDGGVVVCDKLNVSGTTASLQLTGGSLSTRSTTYSNGAPFVVGGGTNRAVFLELGGSHIFSNGLTVASLGVLSGTGTNLGAVTVLSGGALSPANTNACGTLRITGNVDFQSGAIYEWDQSASATDRVIVTGTLTLPDRATVKATLAGGALIAPAVLFTATNLAGATDLGNWTVAGYPGYAASIQNVTNVVIWTRKARGTMVIAQ